MPSRFGGRPTVPSLYTRADGERQAATYTARGDERCEFEADRDRILHSAAFRRLAGKTQVFGIGQSDFFRTRLTHSLEVAQIAKGIALRLHADPELCEAAALAHDIGHPPFGHKGEEVLRSLMGKHGGFEANAQNLRVLARIEIKLPGIRGLDLTRATFDALLKYKVPFDGFVRKFYYVDDQSLVNWATLGHAEKSFECQVMELADDTAYAVHDLEDGVHAGMINVQRANRVKQSVMTSVREKEPLVRSAHWDWAIGKIQSMTPGRGIDDREQKARRKEAASGIIGEVIRGTNYRISDRREPSPRYRYELIPGSDVPEQLAVLKALNYALLIDDPRVHTLEARAEKILKDLFFYFRRRAALQAYPEDFREDFADAGDDATARARVACDFIAGMTDNYAERMHRRLFTADRVALQDY